MKRFKIISLFLFVVIFFPKISSGQDTAKYQMRENFKREIIIQNKRFRVYNNWFSGGGGFALNSANPYLQTVIAINMNFHIHQYYFRLGGMMSGDNFGLWNNYQFHAGWIPYRKENEKYNLILLGALSYSTGYKFIGLDANKIHVYDNLHPYSEAGGYAEVQYIRKIYYDVGLGGAFFVNVNSKNTIVGIRADLYLSGAYKGYVKGKEPIRRQ
ncbi:MAG TPA: hypothetical protein VFJ43_14790 [Bacteroidia bacterium]|nr:hypothetical protein [Bacteroidia bacterium]